MKDWTLKDWINIAVLAAGLILANWRLGAIERRLEYFEHAYVNKDLYDAREETTTQKFINLQFQMEELKKDYDARGH